MRLSEGNIADDGSFFENVFFLVNLVPTAVYDDNGNGRLLIDAMLDEHHYRHGKNPIYLACDPSKFTARVVASRQFHGKEDVGFEKARLNLGVLK